MSEQKIKYLEHPVSPEEKKKWRDKGYKILDKQFEPARGEKEPNQAPAQDSENQ